MGVCNGLEEFQGMPGWLNSSWGYHGDDGNVFHGSGTGLVMDGFEPYSVSDIIGCGLDKQNRIFFTKNGKKLGSYQLGTNDGSVKYLTVHTGCPFSGAMGKIFPVIRMRAGGRVKANFGQSTFKYDLVVSEDISTIKDLESAVKRSMDWYRRKNRSTTTTATTRTVAP